MLLGLGNAKERGTGEGSKKKKLRKRKKALNCHYSTLRVLLGMTKVWSSTNLV